MRCVGGEGVRGEDVWEGKGRGVRMCGSMLYMYV